MAGRLSPADIILNEEKDLSMPLVQITMLSGRTVDQKRKIAQRITDVMVEEARAQREAVVVTFHEVSKESYASGGVLVADKK
ncbi:MAG TPA: 2-hydroxymuconate tautomerase [Terriglobales bacterium]|nr:2-hydroxymuconate tautomerase [Terriglobales bacterium]